MPGKGPAWLLEEWASRFAAGYEAMGGQALSREEAAPPASIPGALVWRQPFDIDPGAYVEIGVSAAGWRLLGGQILAAAGVEGAGDEDSRPTYLELLRQSLAGLASALSAALGRPVGAEGQGTESSEAEPPRGAAVWSAGDQRLVMTLAASAKLLALLDPPAPPVTEPAVEPGEREPPRPTAGALELLYDVELPVSVSFGRAQLPVKDVMKLTSGSIVELNRGIADPVEIIVNNCVIARGEVVVVDGNYGVRILEIVSRSERLRTLH